MATEEVEQLITFPLETALNGLPGVESIRSVSSAGLSFVYVSFGWSTDIYRARQVVAERLATLESVLPEAVLPRMGPVSCIMGEILQVALPIDAPRVALPADLASAFSLPRLPAASKLAAAALVHLEDHQRRAREPEGRIRALPRQREQCCRIGRARLSGDFRCHPDTPGDRIRVHTSG